MKERLLTHSIRKGWITPALQINQKETIELQRSLLFAKANSIFKEILSYSETRFYSGKRKRLAAKNTTKTTGLLWKGTLFRKYKTATTAKNTTSITETFVLSCLYKYRRANLTHVVRWQLELKQH